MSWVVGTPSSEPPEWVEPEVRGLYIALNMLPGIRVTCTSWNGNGPFRIWFEVIDFSNSNGLRTIARCTCTRYHAYEAPIKIELSHGDTEFGQTGFMLEIETGTHTIITVQRLTKNIMDYIEDTIDGYNILKYGYRG
jgi:hypothetical protein